MASDLLPTLPAHNVPTRIEAQISHRLCARKACKLCISFGVCVHQNLLHRLARCCEPAGIFVQRFDVWIF